MTWRIELTSRAVVFTDTPLDFDKLGGQRWLMVMVLAKAVDGTILRDRPTVPMYINIAQIVTIREVELV